MKKVNPAEIKILVVDDNADTVRSTAHLLKQAGYTTATAANGVEALTAVPTFQPDMVLSDCDMPQMDGLELCHRIKADPALADIFLILISGSFTRTEEQATGLELGADSYIARPIANRELLARVEAFVRIVRLNRELRELNRELREKNAALEAALGKVKLLSGMLPICAGCKKIRDDKGYWNQVESYVQQHSEATFSHGLCPVCTEKYFPGLADKSTTVTIT
jgi:DNA-binding response OmpR family regulator